MLIDGSARTGRSEGAWFPIGVMGGSCVGVDWIEALDGGGVAWWPIFGDCWRTFCEPISFLALMVWLHSARDTSDEALRISLWFSEQVGVN